MSELSVASDQKDNLRIHAVGNLPSSLRANECILKSIEERITEFADNVASTMEKHNPYNDCEAALIIAEHRFDVCEHTLVEIKKTHEGFEEFAQFAKFPANQKYWKDCFSKMEMHRKIESNKNFKVSKKNKNIDNEKLIHRQLIEEWRKNFIRESENWKLTQIQVLKSAFLKELDDWIERLRKISQFIKELGLEPGYLLDFSEGDLTLSDISILKKWLEIVENDKGIERICQILGRIRQISHSTEIARTKTVHLSSSYIQDRNSKEEIIGLKMGNEIEHAVSSELSLLSSADTEILFYLKFTESQLLCFDMTGQQIAEEEIEIYRDQEVVIKDNKGPIVICVDTSGSMHGPPENVAKAISLHLVNLARQDGRDCYLINFSTSIETLDFASGIGFDALLGFLQKSFHGGTDIAPAISHAVIKMNEDKYKDADLIVLSDFVMPSLPESILADIELLRSDGNKFHSLCISQEFLPDRLNTLFDQEWVYNPHNSSVTELISFCESVVEIPVSILSST